jgi:hypothetical protein
LAAQDKQFPAPKTTRETGANGALLPSTFAGRSVLRPYEIRSANRAGFPLITNRGHQRRITSHESPLVKPYYGSFSPRNIFPSAGFK